ncbi:MAG: hypothetical protein QM796_20095 [Chthoniobacteraceae bacterium]
MMPHHFRLRIAGGKSHQQRRHQPDQRAPAQIKLRLGGIQPAQLIEGPDRRNHKRAGHQRRALIVRELHERPRIQQIRAQVRQHQRPIRSEGIPHRMLHEGVRHQNEQPREPAPGRDANRREKVIARPEPFLAPDQRANEGAFQKEREHALHRQRLPDDAAAVARKARPVRAELKFHRDAGHHPDRKVQPKDFRPEPRGLIVFFLAGPERLPFPKNEKPRQPHRELREEVMIGDGKGELDAMPERGIGEWDAGISHGEYEVRGCVRGGNETLPGAGHRQGTARRTPLHHLAGATSESVKRSNSGSRCKSVKSGPVDDKHSVATPMNHANSKAQ